MISRFPSALPVLALIGLVGPAMGQDSVAPPRPRFRIVVPGKVAAFERYSRQDFPNRADGSVFRYRGPDSLRADVYLYPGPGFNASCDSACAERVIEGEISVFKLGIPALIKQKLVDSMWVIQVDTLYPTPEDHWRLGRRQLLGEIQKGATQRSEYVLYYLPSVRLKVRISFVESESRLTAVQEFLAEVASRFVSSPSPPADSMPNVFTGRR